MCVCLRARIYLLIYNFQNIKQHRGRITRTIIYANNILKFKCSVFVICIVSITFGVYSCKFITMLDELVGKMSSYK